MARTPDIEINLSRSPSPEAKQENVPLLQYGSIGNTPSRSFKTSTVPSTAKIDNSIDIGQDPGHVIVQNHVANDSPMSQPLPAKRRHRKVRPKLETSGTPENRSTATVSTGKLYLSPDPNRGSIITLTDDPVVPAVSIRSSKPETDPEAERASSQISKSMTADNGSSSGDYRPNYPPDLYMRDGKRLIDFVFAYEPQMKETSKLKSVDYQKYRSVFEKKLRAIGMQFKATGLDESQDGKTCFMKMHAPLKTLAVLAEASEMRFPLKNQKKIDTTHDDMKKCLPKIKTRNLDPKLDRRDPDWYTSAFRRARARDFLIRDRYQFMSKLQRTQLVWEAIEKTLISPQDIEAVGGTPVVQFPVSLMWLLEVKVFVAAFPLHDGTLQKEDMTQPLEQLTSRQRLRRSWANYRSILKSQPIDEVRNYFGEKIGMYFAWLGYYTQSLIVPSVLGALVPIFGLAFVWTDPPTSQICSENSKVANWTVCRTCAALCPYTTMHSYCGKLVLSSIFTNYAVVVYTIIMSLWSAMFQERWKRTQSILASHWETLHHEPHTEQVRPEYYRFATIEKPHPVTGKKELFVPERTRWQNITRSIVTVFGMVLVVIGAVAGIIFYKTATGALLERQAKRDPALKAVSPTLVVMITGSVLNTTVILILSKVYQKLAWWLTEHEYPRTWAEFERSYVMKMYMFQFINYYALMFYLCFVEGNLSSYPFTETASTGTAKTPGYLAEVTMQLAIIIIVKSVVGNLIEVGIPLVKIWLRRRKNIKATDENPYSQWERDFDLVTPAPLSLTDEYFEMILQYGLITMFVPAFPLAPLLALGNNIFEIRIDATKLLVETQREVPIRSDGIGVFYDLLDFASSMAIVVNGAIIAFSTDFIPRMVITKLHGSLDHYWDYTMSEYVVPRTRLPPGYNSSHPFICHYEGMFRPPWARQPFEDSETWWQVWLAKVSFIFVYEHLVFVLKILVARIVPDVPERVTIKHAREKYMNRQAVYEAEFGTQQ